MLPNALVIPSNTPLDGSWTLMGRWLHSQRTWVFLVFFTPKLTGRVPLFFLSILLLFLEHGVDQAQLLVHGEVAINKFMCNHGISNDVQIERSWSNKDANVVEGLGKRILACIWLIHQAGLRFPISSMLKEVMTRCRLTFMLVSVNLLRIVFAVDTLMQRVGLPFDASVASIQHGTPKERWRDFSTHLHISNYYLWL